MPLDNPTEHVGEIYVNLSSGYSSVPVEITLKTKDGEVTDFEKLHTLLVEDFELSLSTTTYNHAGDRIYKTSSFEGVGVTFHFDEATCVDTKTTVNLKLRVGLWGYNLEGRLDSAGVRVVHRLKQTDKKFTETGQNYLVTECDREFAEKSLSYGPGRPARILFKTVTEEEVENEKSWTGKKRYRYCTQCVSKSVDA